MNDVELAVYNESVKLRSRAHELYPPIHEHSFYGSTTADLHARFPPQKGFIVYQKFRLAPPATDDTVSPTIDMLGTPCERTTADVTFPDSLVTYIPFRVVENQPPDGQPYPNLPVLLVEVKPFLPSKPSLAANELKEAQKQICLDLDRVNNEAVRTSTAVEPFFDIIEDQVCHGILVFGTRCFRYTVTLDDDCTLVDRMDELDGPPLLYYEHNTELSAWTMNIRNAFERWNPVDVSDAERYPGIVIRELQFLDSADYEAYLNGYAYTALMHRWPLAARFFVKPQAKLYEYLKIHFSNIKQGHLRANSYADFIDASHAKAKIPDFMIAYFHGTYDSAVVVVEMKKKADNKRRAKAKKSFERYMGMIYTVSHMRVPGLAILGNKCWFIPWEQRGNKWVPKTEVIYQDKPGGVPPQAGVPLSTIFEAGHPFWAQFDAAWATLRRDNNIMLLPEL